METDTISTAKKHMQGALEHLSHELRSIRAGRASPAIIEGVLVEVYGSSMRLKELASISSPETRQLLVAPFDHTNTPLIIKAIDAANLGLRTSLEGKQQIRVFFPVLDQARRKDLVQQVHEKREKCKIAIRDIRRQANEKIKAGKAAASLPEDEAKKQEHQIQTMTDQFCKDADLAAAEKEKEVLTV